MAAKAVQTAGNRKSASRIQAPLDHTSQITTEKCLKTAMSVAVNKTAAQSLVARSPLCPPTNAVPAWNNSESRSNLSVHRCSVRQISRFSAYLTEFQTDLMMSALG